MRSKITAAVDEYISSHAGTMSQREIADACGIAPSTVNRRLKALRLEGATVAQPPGKPVSRNAAEPTGEDGRMGRLYELRDILYGALLEASPGNLARIAAEYRDVLDEIDRAERQECGDGADDAFDRIARGFASIADRA